MIRFSLLLGCLLSVLACNNDARTLRWSRAYMVAPAGAAPGVMYLTIINGTDHADTLLRITSPVSDQIDMHEEMKHVVEGGAIPVEMVHMQPVKTVAIEAGGEFRFAPGRHHVMITNPKLSIVPGDSIPITLHFAKAGTMQGKASVITYSDVDTAVASTSHSR